MVRPLNCLSKALPHERATLDTGEVCIVSARRFHERADLCQTVVCKPAFTLTALNRDAIGSHFIRPDGLMGAFVTEYPQLNWGSEAAEECRIEDNKPRK